MLGKILYMADHLHMSQDSAFRSSDYTSIRN